MGGIFSKKHDTSTNMFTSTNIVGNQSTDINHSVTFDNAGKDGNINVSNVPAGSTIIPAMQNL